MSTQDWRPPTRPSALRPTGLSSVQFLLGFLGAAALTVIVPILFGVGTVALSGAQGPASDTMLGLMGGAVLLFGVTQLLWNLPLAFLLWAGGKRSAMLGVLMASGILFLLNAACWGLLLGGMAMGG